MILWGTTLYPIYIYIYPITPQIKDFRSRGFYEDHAGLISRMTFFSGRQKGHDHNKVVPPSYKLVYKPRNYRYIIYKPHSEIGLINTPT